MFYNSFSVKVGFKYKLYKELFLHLGTQILVNQNIGKPVNENIYCQTEK